MSDIHALSGAYAIDALDDFERARFERHLADCAECRGEVDSLREAAAMLPETTLSTPPAALRERVLAEIATVRPLPPLTVEPAAPRRFRLASLAAAAAAVIAVGAGVAVVQPWQDDASQVQLSAVDRVLQAADAEEYTRDLEDGSRATVVRSASLNQAVVRTENLPALPQGKVYELWLQHEDDGMVPAGLMTDADKVLLLEGDPADAIGAGITIEPAGGSLQPTGELVALIPFEKA